MTGPVTERRRRGPTYDRAVIDRAKEMRRYGDTYGTIATALDVPKTTVQYWTVSVVPDKSGRWSLAEAVRTTEPDPVTVIRELAAVMTSSNRRVTAMTRDEARWVTLLARVRPDIAQSGPGSLWQLARSFIEALAIDNEADVRRWETAVAEGLK